MSQPAASLLHGGGFLHKLCHFPGNGRGPISPGRGSNLPGSAGASKSPAQSCWIKGQKRQEEMLPYLRLAREQPGARSFKTLPASDYYLSPPTQENTLTCQHLPAGELEMKECQYSKACLGSSDMMIIAIAYNHT